MLRQLQKLGIAQTVMMTGDSDRTARAIAAQVGVDRCFAEVLPEDKAAFVRDAKAEGHTVVMIGDGINDSPALCSASTRPSSFWELWASCPLPPAPCCITFPPLASACAA